MLRSHLLIHWTGKDIHKEVKTLTDAHRRAYIDRLFDIIRQGFWMKRPSEILVGGNARSGSGRVSFKYNAAMTCFTEVRLSVSARHAALYGLLGVAVDRMYVLERWGSLVHYVRNHGNEHIVAALFDLRYLLKVHLKGIDSSREEALRDAEYLGVFLKPMSTSNTDDFAFLDEHEWRVVAMPRQVELARIKETGHSDPPFKLMVGADEVRLVVLPDDSTRKMALVDLRMKEIFFDSGLYPPLLTLEECTHL